jgi:hypothetical protein
MKPIYTIEQYCLARYRTRTPALPFPMRDPRRHGQWRRQFTAAIWRELGERPDRVPPRPRVVERKDCGDYIREKVVLQTERFMWMPVWVLVPRHSALRGKNGKLPAILAAPGHGFGMDSIIGETRGQRDRAREIKQLNYDYGRQAARRGYVVLCPEWRVFGERADRSDWVRSSYRDKCDVAQVAVEYFGVHLLGLDIWDGMRALDYLQSRPEVDPNRIGCLGLSFGGTMTTYLTALDNRIKAACISGYVSTLGNALGPRNANFCGSQAMPGLLKYGDIPDVVLLAAPRPLCIEIGLQEDCFQASDMLRAARYVRRGYRALGAHDRLIVDTFPGKHQWSGRKAWDWFARWLSPETPRSTPKRHSR